ncbi:glycosyltransferase family 4 protein [Cellulomonas hominis]
MHVLLVTHHYLPEVGAPQRRWRNLNRRFIEAGNRVTVLAPSPHYPSGRSGDLSPDLRPGAVSTGPSGETIYRVRFREHGTDLRSRSRDQLVAAHSSVDTGLRRLRRRGERPDVIIATAPGIPSIGAGFGLSRLLHAPLVVEMRDAWPDLITPSGIWGTPSRRGWRGTATRTAHELVTVGQRRADAVVTTTAAFAEVLRRRGMPRIDVIRNGFAADELPLMAPPPARRDELRVLYLGTTGRSQGLRTAVRAAAIAAGRGVPVRLRVVGSGHEGAYLRAEARRLQAPVDFLDRVPRAEVADHYAWADSVLVSLRAWDPFEWTVPSKLYEAMAVGRHVSGSIAGETAIIIREAGAGHVAAPESAEDLAYLWGRLAADRSLLQVGDSGRRWVLEHANFDRLAEHYLQVLGEVAR